MNYLRCFMSTFMVFLRVSTGSIGRHLTHVKRHVGVILDSI